MKVIDKKTIFLTAMLAVAFAISAKAQTMNCEIGDDPDIITVQYQFRLPMPSSDYSYTMTPMFCGATDTIYLSPITVRGARNARKYQRKMVLSGKKQEMLPYLRLDADSVLKDVYTIDPVAYPWVYDDSIHFCVRKQEEGCCEVKDLSIACYQPIRVRPPFAPVIAPVAINTGTAGVLQTDNPVLEHISQYRPYDSTRILRKEKGALYVHFPLDKWTLLHDFRDNAATLDRIVSITRQIMADSTSNVKRIQIIGLASPEGPVKRNNLLAKNRAAALRDYIKEQVQISDSIFEICNGGEAWSELRDQIADSHIDGRDQLLQIIDTEDNADIRERKMKRLNGGKTYRYLKDNVLSDQRNSGFIRIYYDYVPDTAAATINEASELINAQRYDEALQMMQTVKDDKRAYNALGVALYMTGNKEEAIEFFRKAAAEGNQDARRNLEQLQ